MDTTSIRIASVAHLTAAAFVFLPALTEAQTKSNMADQDDIPTFVLDRIDLLRGAKNEGEPTRPRSHLLTPTWAIPPSASH